MFERQRQLTSAPLSIKSVKVLGRLTFLTTRFPSPSIKSVAVAVFDKVFVQVIVVPVQTKSCP